jgi:hypothetical protein
MDVSDSDGKQGGYVEVGEGGEDDEIVVPALQPMDGAEPSEDGESGTTAASVGGGKLSTSGDASAGGSVAGTPRAVTAVMGVGITGARVRTPRQSRAPGSSQSSNFSELMQFMLMRAETERKPQGNRGTVKNGKMPRIVVDTNERRLRRGKSIGLNGNYKTSLI